MHLQSGAVVSGRVARGGVEHTGAVVEVDDLADDGRLEERGREEGDVRGVDH